MFAQIRVVCGQFRPNCGRLPYAGSGCIDSGPIAEVLCLHLVACSGMPTDRLRIRPPIRPCPSTRSRTPKADMLRGFQRGSRGHPTSSHVRSDFRASVSQSRPSLVTCWRESGRLWPDLGLFGGRFGSTWVKHRAKIRKSMARFG